MDIWKERWALCNLTSEQMHKFFIIFKSMNMVISQERSWLGTGIIGAPCTIIYHFGNCDFCAGWIKLKEYPDITYDQLIEAIEKRRDAGETG